MSTIAAAPEAALPAIAPPAERLVFYDAAKLVAAIGVVFFHAHVPFAQVWYSGMFLFVFFVGYAPGRSRTLAQVIGSRARRLLLPWLFWIAVYLPLALASPARWLATREQPALWLLIGPVIHLWFLPFAFVMGIVFAALKPAGTPGRIPPLPLRLGVLVVGMGLLLWAYHHLIAASPPIPQWMVSLPMALAGFVIAQGEVRRGERLVLFAALVLVAAGSMLLGQVDGALQMLVIAPICYAAITVRAPGIPVLTRLGDMAFGVYLLHPAVGIVARRVPVLAAQPYLLAIVLVLGALALTALLRTTRLGRFVT